MFYIIIIILTIISALTLGIFRKNAVTQPKKYIVVVSAIGLVVSLIMGLYIGTAYTHGFDIPWWFFSILFFIMILVPCLILVALAQLKLKVKKRRD